MFLDNMIEESEISIEDIVLRIEHEGSITAALVDLSDDYIQFYFDNQKKIDKLLKKQGITEGAEDLGYLGTAPDFEKAITKKIRYKGEIVLLIYHPDRGVWEPQISFRSVSDGMKYARKLIDQSKEDGII